MMKYVSITANDIETFIKNGQKYTLNSSCGIDVTKVESYEKAFSNLSVLSKCSQQYSIAKGKTFVAKVKSKFLVLDNTSVFWVRGECLYTYSYDFMKYTVKNLDDLLYDLTEYRLLVPLKENEATTVAFYNIWNKLNSGKKIPKNISDYALKLKVPAEWRKCTNTLYRGIRFSDDDIFKLQESGDIPLEPRAVTSWTTDINVAKDFILNFQDTGVIVKGNPRDFNIILNTNKVKYLPDYLTSEKEVLVKGNGIDVITKKNAHKIFS